jgi:hypothetical protein
MDAYKEAVSIAKREKQWNAHPNKKRKTQKIALINLPVISFCKKSSEPRKKWYPEFEESRKPTGQGA